MGVVFWILFAFAWLSLLEALYSLRGGFRFREYVLRKAAQPPPRTVRPATLVVPCRGLDPGFEANLAAYFGLDHPAYQLVLVTDREDDPSVAVLKELRGKHSRVPSHLVIAGSARGRSQKVHNLLAALERVREGDEILAFGDSDIRPHAHWLRCLTHGLGAEREVVKTGFRWYVPQRGNPASVLRSVWNAGIASLLGEDDSPFAWGGAMALRRETFRRCRVAEAWRGALSDDYALTRAVKRSGGRIAFDPRALSLSHEDCSLAELLSWSHRQMAIARVYDPAMWRLALAGQAVNTASLWGSLAAWGAASILGAELPPWTPLWAGLVAATYFLGCWKAALRLQAVGAVHAGAAERFRWAYWLGGPAASLITLQAVLRSAFSREIEWRGIRYRMRAPDATEVVGEGRKAQAKTQSAERKPSE